MPQQERQTAKFTTTQELNNGKYFEKEGFTPNYLLTPQGRRLSRARLVATVVDKFINEDETYGSLTLDDGQDTTQVKFFNELDQMRQFETGIVIEVVGKVREYQGQKYLNGEILKKQIPEKELQHQLEYKKTTIEWEQIRETVQQLKDSGKSQEDIEKEMAGKLSEEEVDALLQSFGETFDTQNNATEQGNLERKILEAIENLETGEDGADYQEIAEEVDVEEEQLEDTINNLLSEGTCYEPQPGKIKKL